MDELLRRETASVFSLIATGRTPTQQIVANLGYKVTARLTDHIVQEDGFTGVQLWHRRMTPGSSPKLPNFT